VNSTEAIVCSAKSVRAYGRVVMGAHPYKLTLPRAVFVANGLSDQPHAFHHTRHTMLFREAE
jgi:hypothetical protein